MSIYHRKYTGATTPPSQTPPRLSRGDQPPSHMLSDSNRQSPDSRHHAQMAAHRRNPARAASASPHVTLHGGWAKAGQGRRLRPSADANEPCAFEQGYEEESRNKRPRSSLTALLGWSGSGAGRLRRSRYLVYALVIISLLAMVKQILLPVTEEAAPMSAQGKSSARSHLTSARASRRLGRSATTNVHTRAPLPPALYSKRSAGTEHQVDRDGLLVVNPQSTIHPIYQLIRDARKTWDDKVARQSKTLRQAVDEYKRRYGRNPPKGFDKWWQYVCENDVPLPDEYDQIHKDLLPFRALSPADLNKRIQDASTQPDTYVLRVKRGSIRTNVLFSFEAIHGANERLEQQADLLRPVAKWLPDLEVVWSVHDTPRSIIGWDHRRELTERVEEDEWFDPHEEIDLTLRGWSSTCPPGSPIKTFDEFSPPPIDHLTSTPDSSLWSKKFIASHSDYMDICAHPDLIPIHGFLAGKGPVVEPLTPIFTLSKTTLHSDILGVPVEQWVEAIREIPWTEKKEDRLLWRGSNTGMYHSTETPWRDSHRTRLIKMTNFVDAEGHKEELDVLPPPRSIKANKLEKGTSRLDLGEMNDRLMDLAFTDVPIQCRIDDGTCDDLSQEYVWTEPMTHDDALEYKYVLDVDGNAWSARFKRLLASGSLIFKATIMPEWWTDRIQAWVHYVPVQMDYSDLYDTLIFFRGDQYNLHGEPALAADIASAGQAWSATHWRKEDMVAYMFRLYLEWGRLTAPRRSIMDLVYSEEMEMGREE